MARAGRARRNAPLPQPDLPDIAAITAEPRGYGFHATLKPPMRLAAGRDWFACSRPRTALAGRIAPFELPELAVSDVHGFLALRETVPCPAAASPGRSLRRGTRRFPRAAG